MVAVLPVQVTIGKYIHGNTNTLKRSNTCGSHRWWSLKRGGPSSGGENNANLSIVPRPRLHEG